MTLVVAVAFGLVAIGGTAVVLSDRPERQALVLAVYGLLLAILFAVLEAPDVALSQIAVGTAFVPLMVMLAIRRARSEGAQR